MPNRSFEAMLLPMPDFRYHYMSIESLISMMNAESFQKGHLLKFHQSSIFHMNDGLEYGWFEAKTDEGGDKYIVKFEIGDPFAFCFSECEDCIPMWEMYGNHAKGVCLKFYAKKLRNFIEKEVSNSFCSLSFKQINYKTFPDKRVSQNWDGRWNELCQYAQESIFIKSNCFKQEREWRIASWHKAEKESKIKYKCVEGNVIPYIDLPIPAEYICEILVGPRCNSSNVNVLQNFFYQIMGDQHPIVKKSSVLLY